MDISPTSKSCGDCGLCCKLLAIQTLDKPAGAWCGHFRKGGAKGNGGCGIYEERPGACRGFECMWLYSARLDEAWKPNRAHFLMYTEKDEKRLNIVVDPADPMAWKREPYYSFIKRMSRRVEEGFELVVCIGDRRIVVFPHEDADLGVINPEHKLIIGHAMQEGQRVPFAMVVSDTASGEGEKPPAFQAHA